jgi:Asp/Glu/hydantoin racemase
MATRLGLVHTSATLVPVFAELLQPFGSKVSAFNIVDDSLIKDVIRDGELTPGIGRRVVDQIGLAERAGAEAILVTCSSIGPAVELAARLCGVPVLRVDLAMADRAVEAGGRIGVLATLATTLAPTVDLVERRAAQAGRRVAVTAHVCPGAFDALMAGDAATHDAAVLAGLRQLLDDSDVVLLAQASMARVAACLSPDETTVPVLASPPLAVADLAARMGW